MRSRRGRTVLLIAALSLLSLVSALYEGAFVHTDDGCEVEVHCLACRLAASSAPEAPSPPESLTRPQRLPDLATRVPGGRTLDRTSRRAQARAPPAA